MMISNHTKLGTTKDSDDLQINIKMEAEANFILFLPQAESENSNENQSTTDLRNPSDSCKIKEKCEICHKKVSNLRLHMDIHEKSEKLKCDHCGTEFIKTLLKRHMKLHRSERKFKCEICDFGFSEKQIYEEHLLTHPTSLTTNLRPLQCGLCFQSFHSVNLLEMHTLKFHTKEGTFNCSQCKFTAKTYHALFSHKSNHKKLTEKLVCSICKREFSTLFEFNEHKKTEMLKCEFCEENFGTQSTKLSHIRKIHGEF